MSQAKRSQSMLFAKFDVMNLRGIWMITNWKMTQGILTACLLLGSFDFSVAAFSQSIVPRNEPLVVGGKSYPVVDGLSIIVNRDSVDSPMMTIRSDGRYKFVSFLTGMTQERPEAPNPEPRQLYRLAEVLDTESGKTLQVAIPIRFQPPIRPIRP